MGRWKPRVKGLPLRSAGTQRRGATEDESGRHHHLNGHESEQTEGLCLRLKGSQTVYGAALNFISLIQQRFIYSFGCGNIGEGS